MSVSPERTLEKFGYAFDSLSTGSAKLIVYVCDQCQVENERQRRRVTDPLFCHQCAVVRARPPEAIAKFKQTMLARYGVEHALQNPRLQRKMEARNVEKYGAPNVSSVPEVAAKRQGWWARKHGT